MSLGDSTAKQTIRSRRSRHVPVVAMSLMAIACVNVDRANAAEMANPIAISVTASNSSNSIEPAQLHVNPALGNDQTGDGSLDRPFQTITHALDRARAKTIVILAPGTYSAASGEQFPIQLRAGVTVYGDPDRWGDAIEIVGGGWLMTPTAGEQSVAILGFDGAGLSGVTVRNPDGSAIWVAGGMPWIVGNTIAENEQHGIVAHDGTPYIVNNRFEDNEGSDLEFSDRAMPQLQDNQQDRQNAPSISYFVTATGETIAATNPAAQPARTQPARTQPERIEPALAAEDPEAFAEIVTWEGETSFPPIVRPSESIAAAPVELDPITARSLPIDPDLTSAEMIGANTLRSNSGRSTTTANRNPNPTIAPPERIPAIVRDPFESLEFSEPTTPIRSVRPSSAASVPTRTSNQRLPAVPTVASPNLDRSNNRSELIDATSNTTNGRDTAPIVTWGTPAAIDDPPERLETRETTAAESLLRWDALEGSASTTSEESNELPAPVVNPAATRSTARSTVRSIQSTQSIQLNQSPQSTPNRRPEPIVIASQTPNSTSANTSVDPFERASLPLAYAPSNVAPNWPQPRPTAIPGFVPLPVPDPNPPIGAGGTLPPPPSSTVSLNEIPPGLVPVTTPANPSVNVRYRILVEMNAGLERVQAIASNAFTTQIDGREVIQAGVFRDRWRADQLVADLAASGFSAWVMEF